MNRTGIILSGGKSSRMGQDKALLPVEGTPMISHASNLLRRFCDEIIIASSDELHATFGDQLVHDTYPNSGPIAGIHAGVSKSKHSASIVLSCDTPFIHNEVIHALLDVEIISDAIVARCAQKTHPLIAIYHKSALPYLEHALQSNSFKLMTCLEKMRVTYVDFPSSFENNFQNINTPDQIAPWNEL